MDNFLICNNCKTVNPLYAANCKSCNSFLRSKVANIDLWDSVWNLMTDPIKTTIKLIQSEKKNFLILLLILWLFKSAVNNYIIKNYFISETEQYITFNDSLLQGGVVSVGNIALCSYIMKYVFSFSKVETRFNDNFLIYTFALTPILLCFVFLTPFHFALYGFYWYSVNPSPLIIKPIVTYVLYAIEGLFMVWTLLLFILVTYTQSNKIVLSLVAGLIIFMVAIGFHFLQM